MRKTEYLIAIGVLTFTLAGGVYAQNTNHQSDEVKRLDAAANVLDEIMATPDKGIPQQVLTSAKCIAVVPSMLKGGFIVGGRYGRGVATCRTPNGWSAPAPFTVAGGSWGLQFGGEAVDLVMLVMNQKGMQELLASKFKLGADASVAAGPVGRDAEGSTDWKMKSEVLTYSRSRGLFAGIDLNGAVIKQDNDETRVLYGKMVPFAAILNGKVPPPAGTQRFLSVVRKYTTQAKQEQGSNAVGGPAMGKPPLTNAEAQNQIEHRLRTQPVFTARISKSC